MERTPPITGASLVEAIAKVEATPPFLVNDLIPEEATMMFSSDGAVGKSMLLANAAVSMSAGLPVFEQFWPARPLKVVFIMGERTWREPVRRIKRMAPKIKPNPENLLVVDTFAGTCNMLQDSFVDEIIDYINKYCPKVDIIIIDPIYSMVAGALSDDKVGNLLSRQLTRLKRRFDCVLLFAHHNVKVRMDKEGKGLRPANPFYGSIWLYNHISAQYGIEKQGPNQTLMTNLKDNWGVLLKYITLHYDPECEYVWMDPVHGPLKTSEKFHHYLRAREADGMTFSIEDAVSATSISPSQIYRIFHQAPWAGRVKNQTPTEKKATYSVSKVVSG